MLSGSGLYLLFVTICAKLVILNAVKNGWKLWIFIVVELQRLLQDKNLSLFHNLVIVSTGLLLCNNSEILYLLTDLYNMGREEGHTYLPPPPLQLLYFEV
jgi:hypothetical protein